MLQLERALSGNKTKSVTQVFQSKGEKVCVLFAYKFVFQKTNEMSFVKVSFQFIDKKRLDMRFKYGSSDFHL